MSKPSRHSLSRKVFAASVAVTALLATLLPATSAGAAPTSPATAAAPLVVDTTSGRVHGVAAGQAREFLGVRYAVPPTGARRWTMPVAPSKPAGTVDATKPGASCPQATAATGSAPASSVTSEDCLFLNVTTPADARPGERLPVMVWWHGGGFTTGSGAAYDAQRLATQGHVMVVTVNYRLGVFGYLAVPGLAGGGDFGLADQILATRWARHNAAAFGGDPDNLTVFGESAGAISACAFMTSPAAVGLVDKIAMSSGGTCQFHWPQDGLLPGTPEQASYLSKSDAQAFGVAESGTVGCTGGSIACLRGLSTTELTTISGDFTFPLTYGTPLLPTDPAQAVRAGRVVDVPVLSSGNHDEERAFVGGAQLVEDFFTDASYPTYLRSAFGADAGRVAARYPLSAYPSAAIAWSTVITDASWACPTLAGNSALAAHGLPVYSAEFDDPTAPDVSGVATADFDPAAAHASDLPYLFDLGGKDLLTGSAQHRLAARMVAAYVSFAHTGVPIAGYSPWPRVTGSDGPVYRFGPQTSAVAAVAADHRCAFWSTVPEA